MKNQNLRSLLAREQAVAMRRQQEARARAPAVAALTKKTLAEAFTLERNRNAPALLLLAEDVAKAATFAPEVMQVAEKIAAAARVAHVMRSTGFIVRFLQSERRVGSRMTVHTTVAWRHDPRRKLRCRFFSPQSIVT